jgi:hypothetical protein
MRGGGYLPASADEVWRVRSSDRKGKQDTAHPVMKIDTVETR